MPGLQDAAIQMAETIQTAHVVHQPSVEHDMAPSTAADKKEHVRMDHSPDLDDVDGIEDDEIPVSILRPAPRGPQLPPLPDLRFEQSYLASIKDAKGWQGVTFITIRDQVFMPLVQGMAWTLIVAGWRFMNQTSRFSGQSVGAKIRRWWWETNNWVIPKHSNGTLRDQKVAQDVEEFYTTKISSSGHD